MLCSFCSKQEPVRIDISSMDLRICPSCFATFLPASQFGALRREIMDPTKEAWIRRLQTKTAEYSELRCLEHQQPLVSGTIPGYSFEGLVPTCCDLQHIPPTLMIKILKMGLGTAFSASKKSKINPVAKLLGGIVFYFWEKRQKKVEDDIDRLQYIYKFKNVLGE